MTKTRVIHRISAETSGNLLLVNEVSFSSE